MRWIKRAFSLYCVHVVDIALAYFDGVVRGSLSVTRLLSSEFEGDNLDAILRLILRSKVEIYVHEWHERVSKLWALPLVTDECQGI